ncbi:hypothetical protein acsn021_28890 [Anaerocolumna cellulosilytica]|uniref:Uncharacterized protein n=1 Tax=Anaerocolumna cellulosilytica TaxID=433286 RepID=A0A6S6R741_9FIRM|nr:stage II sporulation protein M [Anaerocolumna cellulosilytica]MBB5197107.1 stage II sporulation protein M [Anaerocolumna cellulosilytica]BCJ95320.1 hypothetical protein acsn021_28890 [Anaerocolumna cellulosilytica]
MNFIKMQLRKLGEVKFGLVLLVIGVICGFVFAKVFREYYWDSISILDVDYINKIKNSAIDESVLFGYVLWNIFQPFVLFWIVSATVLGLPYIALSILYCGFQGSFFVTVLISKYGLKGVLLIFGYTFPHYLLYLPVAFLCLRGGFWLCRSLHYDNLSKKGKSEKIIRTIVLVLFLGFALFLGCLLETYVGSALLKKILVLF